MQNKIILGTLIGLVTFLLYVTSPRNTAPKCEELNQANPQVCNILNEE